MEFSFKDIDIIQKSLDELLETFQRVAKALETIAQEMVELNETK